MFRKRWLQPFFSADGSGGGGGEEPPQEQSFDTATEELMNLLNPAQEPDDTPPDDTLNGVTDGEEGDIDIPLEEPESFNIPVEPDSNYQGMKEDILDEIRKLLPTNEEQQNEGDPPPVEDELNSEEFMTKYMENPLEAITELANKIANQKVSDQMEGLKQQLAPVMQQAQEIERNNAVRNTLTEFMTHPDFVDAGDFGNEIAEYINQNQLPKDDINSYKDAYWRAKTSNLQSNQGKSLDDYLNDENAVGQIASNEAIKQKIITEYLKEMAEGKKPMTLGGDSYSPAAAPATSLNSLDDAGAALLQRL